MTGPVVAAVNQFCQKGTAGKEGPPHPLPHSLTYSLPHSLPHWLSHPKPLPRHKRPL